MGIYITFPCPKALGTPKKRGQKEKSLRALKVPISTVFRTYQVCYSQELSKTVLLGIQDLPRPKPVNILAWKTKGSMAHSY